MGKYLKGDLGRQVQDGIDVEQRIQAIDNAGNGRSPQGAEDGVGKLYWKSATGCGVGTMHDCGREALAAAFGLVHVDDPVGQQALALRLVVAHSGVSARLGVFGVTLIQAITIRR